MLFLCRRVKSGVANEIDNPCSHLFRAVFIAAFHLYFGGADVGVELGVDGFADEGAFLFEVEILE